MEREMHWRTNVTMKLNLNTVTYIFHDWFPQYLLKCFHALLNKWMRVLFIFMRSLSPRPGFPAGCPMGWAGSAELRCLWKAVSAMSQPTAHRVPSSCKGCSYRKAFIKHCLNVQGREMTLLMNLGFLFAHWILVVRLFTSFWCYSEAVGR